MTVTPTLRVAPAAERNREPILVALCKQLGVGAQVLELGAGTGQHVCHFARALPAVRWLPSEHPDNLADLLARVRHEGLPNIAPPLAIDISAEPWPLPASTPIDLCYSANTVHMMADAGVAGLFRGAAGCLPVGGRLCVYGPFAIDGRHTGEGNRRFDAALRERDPAIGLRDLAALDTLAASVGFGPSRRREMPSDNRFVTWTRVASEPSERGADGNEA